MNAKRNALGKGLGALIEDAGKVSKAELVRNSSINEIDIEQIATNPFQPRKEFDEELLNELADSINQLGIIQPITLREIDENKYQLISGERRFRAAKIAGLKKIPAYIRTADDQEMLEMALVENTHREDLDAIEIAISYQRLIDECKLTQEQMSSRVGKKRVTVTNYLRLLKLPAEIQLGIRKRLISMGQARALINIDDINDQLYIFEQILTDGLSVRKIEEMVRELKKPKTEEGEERKKETKNDESYKELEKHLETFFKSKIQFKRSEKGNGAIVINFKNDADLERIVGIFDKIKS